MAKRDPKEIRELRDTLAHVVALVLMKWPSLQAARRARLMELAVEMVEVAVPPRGAKVIPITRGRKK